MYYQKKPGSRSVAHLPAQDLGLPFLPPCLHVEAVGPLNCSMLKRLIKHSPSSLCSSLPPVLCCGIKTKRLCRSFGRCENPNLSTWPQSMEGEREMLIHREISEPRCFSGGLLGHFQIPLCLKLCQHLKSS